MLLPCVLFCILKLSQNKNCFKRKKTRNPRAGSEDGPGLVWSEAWAGAPGGPSAQEPQCSLGPAAIQEQHGWHHAPRQVGVGSGPTWHSRSPESPTPDKGPHRCPISTGQMGREKNAWTLPTLPTHPQVGLHLPSHV